MRAHEQLNSTWTSLPTWRNDFIQLDNSPPLPLSLILLFSGMSHLWYNSHIMAWKRVRQEKDRCRANKKWNGEVQEARESKDKLYMLPSFLYIYKENTHAHTHTRAHRVLYLLSINSVWCWAIGEAIASSPMVSFIEVHASFRRPLCYRSSHLSSVSLASPPLASPCLSYAPQFLLIICLYFHHLPISFPLFFIILESRIYFYLMSLSTLTTTFISALLLLIST